MSETDHQVDISRSGDPLEEEPDDQSIAEWITSSLDSLDIQASEVSVRIVSTNEMAQLNQQYRGIDKPTNVLSFESGINVDDGRLLLGDLVICNQVVWAESNSFEKPYSERFAHMVVHGLLHLLGHDHIEDDDRVAMEAHETELLAQFGIEDPYETVKGTMVSS